MKKIIFTILMLILVDGSLLFSYNCPVFLVSRETSKLGTREIYKINNVCYTTPWLSADTWLYTPLSEIEKAINALCTPGTKVTSPFEFRQITCP